MMIFLIIFGCILIVLGHTLYWVFVGTVGFVAGFEIAKLTTYGYSQTTTLIYACIAGLLGGVFAMFAKKMAVITAGFLAGGYTLLQIVPQLGFSVPFTKWLIFLMGGVLGGMTILVLFDWALVILSSIMGALLIVQGLDLRISLNLPVLAGISLVGIIIQGAKLLNASTTPTKYR